MQLQYNTWECGINGDGFIFKALILGFLDLYTMPDRLEESAVFSLPAKNINRSHEKRQNVVFVECYQKRKLSWTSTLSIGQTLPRSGCFGNASWRKLSAFLSIISERSLNWRLSFGPYLSNVFNVSGFFLSASHENSCRYFCFPLKSTLLS